MDAKTLTLIVIVDVIVVALLLVRAFGQVSVVKAKALLQGGAKVIDVRSPEEFNSGHLRAALNIPYREVGQRIEAVVPDKATPILVYCLSGGRSAVARSALRGKGYAQVYNLGSLKRAKQVVES